MARVWNVSLFLILLFVITRVLKKAYCSPMSMSHLSISAAFSLLPHFSLSPCYARFETGKKLLPRYFLRMPYATSTAYIPDRVAHVLSWAADLIFLTMS